MPQARSLIALLCAALLVACGGQKTQASSAPAIGEVVEIVVPATAAYGPVFVADAKGYWGDMKVALVTADDTPTIVREFIARKLEAGGLSLRDAVLWRSQGAPIQVAALLSSMPASDGKIGTATLVVQQGIGQQELVSARLVEALAKADAFIRDNPAEAAKIIAAASKAEGEIKYLGPADNKAMMAPDEKGESLLFKQMRAINMKDHDELEAGHTAILPDAIDPTALKAWTK